MTNSNGDASGAGARPTDAELRNSKGASHRDRSAVRTDGSGGQATDATSRRRLLQYGVGVLALGGAGVGGYLLVSGGEDGDGPETVARRFALAYLTNDDETARELVTQGFREHVSRINPSMSDAELREQYATDVIDASNLQVDGVEVLERTGDRTRVVVKLSATGDRTLDTVWRSLELTLIRRNGTWRVDDF